MTERSVLQIADYNAFFFSNFLSSLLRLAPKIHDRFGLETVFVVPDQARNRSWIDSIRNTGAQVRFIDRNLSHRERIRRLTKFGTECRAAVYHTHFGTFDVDAAYAARRLHCATIWHMHSPFIQQGTIRQRIGERLKFGLVARLFLDRIVAVSPSVEESAIAHGGPRSKIHVVLNGIDTERVRAFDSAARQQLRRRSGVQEAAFVFLLLGWSPERKGVDIFVRAAQTLPPEVARRCRCLVVRGERNADELREITRGSPFVQMIQPIPDVAELYGLADCFVSASRSEGLPYAPGEAMAAALPVISSDLPQVVAAYGPAGPGFVPFRSEDPYDLGAAMTRMVQLPLEERRRRGMMNAEYIQTHLSIEHWTAGLINIYQEILEGRGDGPSPEHKSP